MSKLKGFMHNVKTYWKEPDRANDKYVSYKEYFSIFNGVAFNYGTQVINKYLGFSASCFLVMYHYNLPYLAFSVITLIGLPLSYLWSVLSWTVGDNLGIMEKKTERKFFAFYGCVAALGLLMIVLDFSKVLPAQITDMLNGISGITAKSFCKIFGIQLFVNAYGGGRSIVWKKKLVPKHGRYKYELYANFVQKSIALILLGWLPIYNVKSVDDRLWMVYLLFTIGDMFPFTNVIENCTNTISPNPQERLWVRTVPVKLAHLLNNVFAFIIPLFGIGFEDINFYRFVIPCTFIPLGGLTLFFVRNIKERIPQPPLEKKQKVSFWYGANGVLHNKYFWLDTFSKVIDSLGNGALTITNVIYFYSMRMYTQCVLYSLINLLWNFRSTPPAFFAPIVLKKLNFKTLKLIKQFTQITRCIVQVGAIYFFGHRQTLCGIILFATEFLSGIIYEIPQVAEKDMSIRLNDYQMYLSGERLENFRNIFNWFTLPISTVVGLIIPLIMLRSGYSSNWDVLFIDSTRLKIIAVPIIFDLVGHALMVIPYLFWDYNNEQHNYVMEVLKQRERLSQQGYIPAEYEGGLDFIDPGQCHARIPVNSEEMLNALTEPQPETAS